MKIFDSEDIKNKNYIKRFLIKRKGKYVIFKLMSFLCLGILFFIPLDLYRSSNPYIRKTGDYLSISAGLFGKKYYYLAKEIFATGDNLFGISFRYFRSFFINPDQIRININFNNYQRLNNLRDKAIKDGILIRSKNDKVKGYIDFKNKRYPIKIRLKGDWTDHLLGDKWSFRIESKKRPFLGMQEFSLQHPRTRNYINEYIFHEILKFEKLPFLRYQFLPLYLNGNYLGIYAIEEHFGKEMVENSEFREGPILKLSDADKRNERQRMLKISKFRDYTNSSENNAEIDTFNKNKIAKNEFSISQYHLSRNLLNKYLENKLKTSEIFDIKLTAKYFAICDLLQSLGANTWYDMRFYFDPIQARFIPIGYDAQTPLFLNNRQLSIDQNTLNIFQDEKFVKEYLLNLNRISKDRYLKQFLNEINIDLNQQVKIINKSFPFARFIKDDLLKNKAYIRNRLSPINPIGINNNQFNLPQKEFILELNNKTNFPLRIISMSLNGKVYDITSENLLPRSKPFERVKSKIFKFKEQKSYNTSETKKNINGENKLENLKSINSNNILIKYKIEGIPDEKTSTLSILNTNKSTSILNPLVERKPTYKKFNSLKIDNQKKKIYIKKDLKIDKPLILPIDYELIISQGIKIIIENQGYILTKGPLRIMGNKNHPVLIKSLNKGSGIFVLNSLNKSTISHVFFDGLNASQTPSINITGGLTFYNSEVEIINSNFQNSVAEDSLNIVRSQFIIKDTKFLNSRSDAIDIDFSDGSILNSTFEKIGNDSIDLSGSKVSIKNISIFSSGDKGISIGEKSNLYGENIYIDNAFIGLASKDLSKAVIKNIKINNSVICLAAYRKKGEFGPGYIKISDSNPLCKDKYILESGSIISFDNQNYLPNTEEAYKEIYYKDNIYENKK